jgi:hypothetical protein
MLLLLLLLLMMIKKRLLLTWVSSGGHCLPGPGQGIRCGGTHLPHPGQAARGKTSLMQCCLPDETWYQAHTLPEAVRAICDWRHGVCKAAPCCANSAMFCVVWDGEKVFD